VDPNTSAFEKPLDAAGGVLSSLATQENLPKTAAVLSTAILATQPLKPGSGLCPIGKLSPGSVGAGFGSGFDTLGQLAKNGGDLNRLDYGHIGVSGATGYLAGSLSPIASLWKNPFVKAGISSLIGGGVSAIDATTKNVMDHKSNVFDGVLKNSLFGGALSGLGSLLGSFISTGINASQPRSYTRIFDNQQQYFRGIQVPNSFFGSNQNYREIPNMSPSEFGATLGDTIANVTGSSSSLIP
jgi:hypothetical protein